VPLAGLGDLKESTTQGWHGMKVSKYEKFVVQRPIPAAGLPEVKGRQWPPTIFMSSGQVPEADVYVELGWIYGIPEPDEPGVEQVLDYDQFLLHIGMDPDTPQDLGGTIELCLGGQPIVFNTTTCVFIPKGTPHGPLSWKEFRRPHVQLSVVLGSGDPHTGPRPAGTGEAKRATPKKTQNVDYEQYVIRSPMREAGPDYVEGRQNPTMTYLSRTQIPMVNNYLEFGWIWEVPHPQIPRMRHDDYDEVVWHIGSDPSDPEALGGILEFGIGEDLLVFDTTHCAYIPKEMVHGPLSWKEVRRPLIEIALMLGAGTLEEGWANSFFDLPDGARRGPK
jgi:hypothetical protein